MKTKEFIKKNALNVTKAVLLLVLACMVVGISACNNNSNETTIQNKDDGWHYYSTSISDYSHENYRHGSITTENAEKIEFVSVEEHQFETVKLNGNELKFCLSCGWHEKDSCENYHDFKFVREIKDVNSEADSLYVCVDCGTPRKAVKHADDKCNYIDENGDYLTFNSLIGGYVDDEGYHAICEVCKTTALKHKHENIGNAYLGDVGSMYAKIEDVPACGDWCKDCYYVFENEGHKYELHIAWGRSEKQISVGGTLIEYDNKNCICYFLKCPHCEAEVLLDVKYSDFPLSEDELNALATKYSVVIVDERT